MNRLFTLLLASCACAFVAACGSGSSNNMSNNNGNTPAQSSNQPGGSGSGSGSGGSSSGAGGSGGTTAGASSSAAAVAYVSGSNNDLNGVWVDGAGNVSSTSGSPYSVGGAVQDIAINGALLYADWSTQNPQAYHLTAYKADANGALTQLGTMSVGGWTIGFDPTGGTLYVGTLNGFDGYQVDRSTGALTPLPGSPYSHPAFMGMVFPEVSPDGSHLCAHNNGPKSDAINCFVRHADGSLDTSVAHETTPLSQSSLPFYVITSDGAYVIATDLASQVLINAVASSTNPGTGNRVSSGGQTPIGIARTGQWIAVANQKSNTISVFTVNSAGQLMQVGSPVNTVSAPFRLAFSQNGNYLFASSDSGMESFQFNSTTGALSPLNGGKAVAGTARAIAAQ